MLYSFPSKEVGGIPQPERTHARAPVLPRLAPSGSLYSPPSDKDALRKVREPLWPLPECLSVTRDLIFELSALSLPAWQSAPITATVIIATNPRFCTPGKLPKTPRLRP